MHNIFDESPVALTQTTADGSTTTSNTEASGQQSANPAGPGSMGKCNVKTIVDNDPPPETCPAKKKPKPKKKCPKPDPPPAPPPPPPPSPPPSPSKCTTVKPQQSCCKKYCPPCPKCPAPCPRMCPDLSRYVLKQSIPRCPPATVDETIYMRRSECRRPDMSQYVLKSSIADPVQCPACICDDTALRQRERALQDRAHLTEHA